MRETIHYRYVITSWGYFLYSKYCTIIIKYNTLFCTYSNNFKNYKDHKNIYIILLACEL